MYKLFYNGVIHTLHSTNKSHEALLVLGDRIIFCGRSSQINLPAYQLNKINLAGRHVYPGFIDCHTHIASTALKRERLSLDHCQSREEALQTIGKFAGGRPAGTWLTGGGWNANEWSDGPPAKEYLDRICPDHPVALYNKDGHTMWLNSLALDLCGFHAGGDLSGGGFLGNDDKGELDGLVFEKACELVEQKVGEPSYEALLRCMKSLSAELYRLGITSAHSCEGMDIWIRFQKMAAEQKLPIRICMHPPASCMEDFLGAGLRSAFGSEWLRLGGFKYFVDGSLGSQTAEMFDNFDHLAHAGIEVMTEEDLAEQIQRTAAQGMSSTIHAIGDKAVFKTLNALQKSEQISKEYKLRQRIEHAQILRKKDIERFGRLGIIASMQPVHISDDVKLADYYLGRRSRYTYPVKSLMASGCRVVFGSDMPVADMDPLKGIRAAVGRRYQLDPHEPSWQPQECITAKQALCAYTTEAAYASYEELIKGTLTAGKLADFIVSDSDIEQADERQLSEMKIEMTVLGGSIVYREESV
jgi:hypothetical protein